MPELPEVEVTKEAIKPVLLNQTLNSIDVHCLGLRWPIDVKTISSLNNTQVVNVSRRGKYILLELAEGTLIIHLGMSGYLRISEPYFERLKHDHVVFHTDEHAIILNDARRFGALLFTTKNPLDHKVLKNLGIEPLSAAFNSRYLHTMCMKRKVPIKQLIMNSNLLVGVGNIYAQESLFLSGIHPSRPAETLDREDTERLTKAIKKILRAAIKQGGTTLKDFKKPTGKPGYFKQSLQVYGRANEACQQCHKPLESARIQGRSTVFCSECQI